MRTVTIMVATLRQRWRTSLWWTVGLVAMTAIQLYVYPSIQKTASAMDQFVAAFPPEIIAIFRIEDYTSPEGFLSTELFSMIAFSDPLSTGFDLAGTAVLGASSLVMIAVGLSILHVRDIRL